MEVKVKVYAYETEDYLDMVYVTKDFGVVAIEDHSETNVYGVDAVSFEKRFYTNLYEYEQTINGSGYFLPKPKLFKKTYLGEL